MYLLLELGSSETSIAKDVITLCKPASETDAEVVATVTFAAYNVTIARYTMGRWIDSRRMAGAVAW
jgi:hypothetical protein